MDVSGMAVPDSKQDHNITDYTGDAGETNRAVAGYTTGEHVECLWLWGMGRWRVAN